MQIDAGHSIISDNSFFSSSYVRGTISLNSMFHVAFLGGGGLPRPKFQNIYFFHISRQYFD